MTPRRLLVAALAAPLLVLPAASPAGGAATAPAAPASQVPSTHSAAVGALFDNAGEGGLRSALLANVNAAPRGSTIRVVTMSYTDPLYTSALRAAHDRGVNVQVLVSLHKTRGVRTVSDLGRELNRNPRDKSFLRRMDRSARGADTYRGSATILHQKSWTFSRTGSSRWVTIITSANLTTEATENQYNDGYAWVGDKARYDVMSRVFSQQRRDEPVARPYRSELGGALTFGPHDPGMADPVVARINALPANRLTIRVGVAAWSGGRGGAIAQALAAKARAGARVNVLVPKPFGDDVRQILRDGGVRLHRGEWSSPQYLHSKFMTAEWRSGGQRVTRVWFGSENWGDAPPGSDEIVARVDRARAHDSWVRWFREIQR